MKLTEYEENLEPEELFFKWLTEEKVDFISLFLICILYI